MIILHFHLQPQFTYELFHIYFTPCLYLIYAAFVYDLFLVVTCGDPGTPTNGVRYGNKFTYQSSVVLECDPQYKLTGDLTRLCQADGSWTGTQPTCERE